MVFGKVIFDEAINPRKFDETKNAIFRFVQSFIWTSNTSEDIFLDASKNFDITQF
jgi:hypothetical protein